jgi:hypothetical protein
MTIQALGYLGIGTDRIDDWTNFATSWLGCRRWTAAPAHAPSAWTTASSAL